MTTKPTLTVIYRTDDFGPDYLTEATSHFFAASTEAATRAGFRLRAIPINELSPSCVGQPQLWHHREDLLRTRQLFQVDDFSWDPQAAHHLKAVCRTVQESDSVLLNRSFTDADYLSTDKLAITQRASRLGLPTPPTIAIPFGRYARTAIPLVEQQIGPGPYIVKPREMGMGFGVMKVDDVEQLAATLDVTAQAGMGYVVQPFIPNSGDLRVYVINRQVAASQHRSALPGRYLANISQGGTSGIGAADMNIQSATLRVADSLDAACLQVDWLLAEGGPIVNEWSSGFGGYSALPDPERARLSNAFFDWARTLL
ncbi:RimK family alpha-L-glutamate ligase [Micromonospora andamanensis]|uniref:ATP-grasp domain-containing protein n=1 Tax=Micromonospora andamanensis TaxID=1287068 RepID=A0ABQ4I4A5_9ACTN|nr:hypothetical protein [Micromonospora andamanensis]GIJ12729.1 hypothetical protein Van01_59430 [Micromonospora andamanensis]